MRRDFALAIVAVVLGGLVYLDALDNPFVYDDHVTVVENASIRNLADLGVVVHGSYFRPVVNFSYALDYAIWGLEPFGFHVTNVILHLVNVVLLFRLAQVTLDESRPREAADPTPPPSSLLAGAVATIFAVHPMMTEAVGYVSGRSEVLCATFVLSSVLALRRWFVARHPMWLVAGLVSWVCALGTKESAAVLPLVLVVYDVVVSKGNGRSRLQRFHLPMIVLAATAAVWRLSSYASTHVAAGQVSVWTYAGVQATVIWRYVLLLIAPVSQSLVHDHAGIAGLSDLRAVAAMLALVGAILLALRLRRAVPASTFGAIWFLLFLAPSSSVVPLGEPMAEHRVYVASCGFFLAIVPAVASLAGRLSALALAVKRTAFAVLVVTVAVLALLTVQRNRVWADPVVLWRDAAEKAPGAWWSNYHLANALAVADRCPEAIPVYQRAIALRPERPLTHVSLALCFASVGRRRDAETLLRAVLKVEPDLRPGDARVERLVSVRSVEREGKSLVVALLGGGPLGFRTFGELYATTFAGPDGTLGLCQGVKAAAPETPRMDECIQTYARRAGDRDDRGRRD